MTTRTLYRAADSDTITGPAAFAADVEDARSYLDNPGFGGATLYRTEIECDDDHVLDVRGADDAQLDALIGVSGCSSPGAMTADAYVMQDHVAAALVEHGYRWVRILDTYPIGAETWVYLYDGEDPEMVEVE